MAKVAVVVFVDVASATATIRTRKEKRLRVENPMPPKPELLEIPPEPSLKASEQELALWETLKEAVRKKNGELLEPWNQACSKISEKIQEALEGEMAEVVLSEEGGHPDLPADYIVRSNTGGNRCQVVGCRGTTPKPKETRSDAKRRRRSHPFCRAHVGVRRMIPRKGGFFAVRGDQKMGVQIAV